MFSGGELNNGEVRVNVASDDTEGGASIESVRLLGNAMGQNNEALELVDFVRDKTLWSQQAPWTRGGGVIAGVVQTVATLNIIPELENPLLDPSLWSEGAADLPRVVKVMLDLMRRSNLELKAASSAFSPQDGSEARDPAGSVHLRQEHGYHAPHPPRSHLRLLVAQPTYFEPKGRAVLARWAAPNARRWRCL